MRMQWGRKTAREFSGITLTFCVLLLTVFWGSSNNGLSRDDYVIGLEESFFDALERDGGLDSRLILLLAERDLDDLQGQPLLVPPTGYSHVTLGLGLATTPTFKRFFMPSESWARDMWRICEALPGESGGYRDFVSMHPSEDFQDYVSRCYENLSADEVTKLAGHFGSKFAILKNRQCDLFNSVAQVSSGAESRCLVSVNPVT